MVIGSKKIIDKISLLDKKQIEDYRILLELKMKKYQKPAKFDLKTIACNIIVPIYLGVANCSIYHIFGFEFEFEIENASF